jgi:PAS domain S-box-containing protein
VALFWVDDVACLHAGVPTFQLRRSGQAILATAISAALLHGAEFYYTAAAYAECPPELRHLWEGEPTHNIMVPLRAGAQVTGMISVDNLTTGRPIAPTDVGPLLALAHQVSTAVERARLQERERAEAALLAASEAQLRAVLATMACGVVSVTPTGLIAAANPTAGLILGQDLDVWQGRPITQLLEDTAREDGAAVPSAERPVAVALRTHQAQYGVVLAATLPDGQRRWLQVDVAPPLDAEGALLQLVVSFIDITPASRRRRA